MCLISRSLRALQAKLLWDAQFVEENKGEAVNSQAITPFQSLCTAGTSSAPDTLSCLWPFFIPELSDSIQLPNATGKLSSCLTPSPPPLLPRQALGAPLHRTHCVIFHPGHTSFQLYFHYLHFLHVPLSRSEAAPSQTLLSQFHPAVSCFTPTSIILFPWVTLLCTHYSCHEFTILC